MKAVVLAAGEGTRLRPFTASEPKVMIPVADKPILQYVVEALVENGITEIIMVVGYHKQRIMSYFEDGQSFGARIEYVEQKKQPPKGGTAHALYEARSEIDDDFIVLAGDNVISKDTLSDFLEEREDCSVLVTRNESPSKYGVVTMDDSIVKNIKEKPRKSPSHLILTGIYSFPPEIFEYINESLARREYGLTSVLHSVMEDRDIKGVITNSTWIDAVYPWDLPHVNSAALRKVSKSTHGTVENNVIIKGSVKIGEGTVIRGGSYIEGPVVIGEGCDIGPQACILPSTSIGDDTKIAPFTVIQNSVLMEGVKLGPNSMMENTVLGDGIKVGSGFSSYAGKADIKADDGFHEIEKIGSMIAEDTQIGSGVTSEAGVIMGENCKVGSGRTVSGKIPPESNLL